MKIGDMIEVGGHIATVASENYTRMVYDDNDLDLQSAGYEGGSSCSFVDVIYNGSAKKSSVNLSRTTWKLL